MELPSNLIEQGFSLNRVDPQDFPAYFTLKRESFTVYVNEYYGGWFDDDQEARNRATFEESLHLTCFNKVMLAGKIVGFFTYNVAPAEINSMLIMLLPAVQRQGIGAAYLQEVTAHANVLNLPAVLKVFRTNPAIRLYQRHGFIAYDKTPSHILMRYTPLIS
ncbi:MAG TPA: GNAT family N-acetyltransferase [Bellilinea sp.]|nr:GNAT family N-acetyltransferase [Bellilinea sp.]